MKKEELLEIGLSEEQAGRVFALSGLDVEREKAKTMQVKSDLADAQGRLAALQTELESLKKSDGDIAAVKQQLSDLQSKYETDTAALAAQLADRDYSDAITRAIGGKGLKFSSRSAERAFIASLKEQKLELKDGELTGLDDFIKAQREADPDAFAPDKPAPRFMGPAGTGSAPPEHVPANVAQAKAMGAERAAAMKASMDAMKNFM